MKLEEILNYYLVTEDIASSGQPGADQFAAIAGAGFEAVVNLALPDSRGALPGEGKIVTALGMTYFHIPVSWEAPRVEDAELFFNVMQALKGRRVWVHCAMNMRVSCFLYLYRRHVLGEPEAEAARPMREIWQPQGAWCELIEEVERKFPG
ncbi:MAG: protein tyrosine phosphatase family protein [Gammaproteobacteria bacterium]|jgi:protein tyrosine phosphatase (PTP) superfamily phosphohydrolase (DUF442 family)